MIGKTVKTSRLLVVGAALLLFPSLPAHAQRALENTGFELNDPEGPGAPTYEIYDQSLVPGWSDQTGEVEVWDSGFSGVTSYAGDRHGEVNANVPGALYQAICMESGETLSYTFAHRHRSGGDTTQTIVFEFKNPDGSDINADPADDIVYTSSVVAADGWVVRSGTSTYLGPSGERRLQFRSLSSSSLGNFVDEIQVYLEAYAEMNIDITAVESVASGPSILVTGHVETSVDLGFSVSGGTATLGSDYTIDASTVTIPAGVYDSDVILLPITIINDTDFESDETIIVDIGAPTSSEVRVAAADCVSTAKLQQTYTIVDDDPNLSVAKTVSVYDPDPFDSDDTFAIPDNDVIYTISIENSGNGPVDAGSLFLVDHLPAEVSFYSGDIDDSGPETNPVAFSQSSAGLSFTYSSHVGFSNSVTRPANFSECSYTPSAGYDMAVRYICISPAGAFANGSPAPQASFSFRTRIN